MKIDENTQRDLLEAEALGKAIDYVIEQRRTHWGVISIAIASVLAEAAHDSLPGNPARARRLINEIHALARGLLQERANEKLSAKAMESMVDALALGRSLPTWSCNRKEQDAIVNGMLGFAKGAGHVEAVAACMTIISNLVCDVAEDEEAAVRGIEAAAGDMQRVVHERFAAGQHAAGTPRGHA